MLRRGRVPWIVIVVILLALVGCDQQPEAVPTLFDPAAVAATATTEATLNAPTATATSLRPTFPPQPTETATPTETPTATPTVITATPEGYDPAGTLFYIYNGDSIARLSGDGSRDELIAVSGPYSDLTISADNKLLAYVGPGSGTAREVYITLRDNPTYVQPVSCLGMANVLSPVWQPDGQAVTFLVSPAADVPLSIYSAGIVGAGNCPGGNNQHEVMPLTTAFGGSIAWHPSGTWLFYTDNAVYALELVSRRTLALTTPGGFGSDYDLMMSPEGDWLAFLRPNRDLRTGISGGHMYTLDISTLPTVSAEQNSTTYITAGISARYDGREILISTPDSVLIYNVEYGTTTPIISDTAFAPNAVFSPDGKQIAFINGGAGNPNIPQIWVISRSGGSPTQMTTHPEGSISNLIWAEG